jgi:UDP-N-acetylmuramate--alanine ligase
MELFQARGTMERIHLVGIGGIGVSGVARAYHALGYQVSGSDARASSITRALAAEGVRVCIGHDPANLADAQRVVVSTAILKDNVEIAEALSRGLEVEHRSFSLDRVLRHFPCSVGVSGTNGKGTVASLLTQILESWGRSPSFIIGGMLENFDTNARVTPGAPFLVAEVDESDGSLVNVHPDVAVLCNLELDHLNYYPSLEAVVDKVSQFLTGNPRLAFAVLQTGDRGSRLLMERLPRTLRVVTYSADPTFPAEVEARSVTHDGFSSSFNLWWSGTDLGRVELRLPGLYNVENAVAAAATALSLGAPTQAIRDGLLAFRGLRNRFSLARAGQSLVIKDYISHPTGMRRVLHSLRQIVGPGLPIASVFKPYRYTMVRYLGDEYSRAFVDADATVITEMWEGGEEPMPGINTQWLVDKVRLFAASPEGRGGQVEYIRDNADVNAWLLKRFPGPFAAIFFGGDDLFAEADRLVQLLEARP